MAVWKIIRDSGAGFCWDLSQSVAIVDWRHNLLLPVNHGSMFIISDYSGQHKGSSHEAYSFLVTTHGALAEWAPIRQEFREKWLLDGRRISFKQLGDLLRWKALIPFLTASSRIQGNLITILVDNRIGSFSEGGALALREIFPDCFPPGMGSKTAEKMLRLASFVAMITAGLRRQDQQSSWVSDHDEALETFDRREQLGRLAAYMTFGFTGWRNPADMWFGTTEALSLPEWMEDVAAIPDLVAGTFCRLASLLPTSCGTETWRRTLSPHAVTDRRARLIGDWLTGGLGQLRQVLLRLELGSAGEPRASAQFFSGYQAATYLIQPT